MTFTKIIKDIFTSKSKKGIDNSSNGGAKRFLSKISGAFMLPISVMAIAGLFLGIGAAIESHTTSGSGISTFGAFIKNMGDPVFGAMPALFMIAIVISFTDDMGTAVFSGIVAFLVFNAMQTPFITSISQHDQVVSLVSGNSAMNWATATTQIGGSSGDIGHAKILFGMSTSLEERVFKLVGSNLGITSLNTSVFGGIVVGFIVAWAYNRFHEIELPSMISFFGGKRFVPFVAIILMIPLTFLFLLVWPWIGIGLAYFGEYSGKIHGVDSFIFGYTERALIPFGLHHVFYAPLWWTGAGGDASQAITNFTKTISGITQPNTPNSIVHLLSDMNGKVMGDQQIWSGIVGLNYDTVTWKDVGGLHSEPVFDFFQDHLGLRIGRFMQGKYGFMQFALPAAGLAMILAAPKENRQIATAIIFPAALTSFVTGVTEPIEFTFVFLAPALFWGFHAVMAGLAFLFMNLLGAHMGMTFSGGIIDTVIYGILPMSKGTHWYWAYVIEAGFAPIYFFVFYWWIKKFNLATPGRGGNTKLFTKADYKAKVGKPDPQAVAIIEAYGGWENITKTANCATRLRFDVIDASKVSEDKLKAAGAVGIMRVSNTHVQAIFGPIAETMHGKIKKVPKDNNDSLKTKIKS